MHTTWRALITEEMKRHGESWTDVVVANVNGSFDDLFYQMYGEIEGASFCIWTENRVYFPIEHDGAEFCASVPRHPIPGFVQEHIG